MIWHPGSPSTGALFGPLLSVPFAHARRPERAIPSAELRQRPGDGHVAVLGGHEASLEWLRSASY